MKRLKEAEERSCDVRMKGYGRREPDSNPVFLIVLMCAHSVNIPKMETRFNVRREGQDM